MSNLNNDTSNMGKNFLIVCAVMLAIASFVASVFAIDIYVQPARMVVTANVTQGYKTVEERYFNVRNTNKYTVVVEISSTGSLKDVVVLKENNITLEPNETKQVYFDVLLTQNQTYQGDINVAFKPMEVEEQPVAVAMGLTIVGKQGHCENCEPVAGNDKAPGSYSWVLAGIAIVFLIILFLTIFKLKR